MSNSLPFWPRGMTAQRAADFLDLPLAAFKREAARRGLRAKILGGKPRFDRLEIERVFFDVEEPGAVATADTWIDKL